MHSLLVATIALMIPALAILALALWNVAAWPRIPTAGPDRAGAVSILIPARNEAGHLGACLESALAQGLTIAEILVYDDHSLDATPDVVKEFGARDRRISLVEPLSLPPGWCGKNFACAQLAAQARAEWLLFLDADARLAAGAVAAMLEEASRRQLTFLSAWPALQALGFWEKVLMPMLNFVVFTLFPAPLSLMRNDPALGLGHGACILAERSGYRQAGGHEAVRDQIFEDRRLAQRWRAAGLRGLCLDGQDLVTVRMYKSLGEIWSGFQKNFFPGFQREPSFWGFLSLHTLLFLAPFVVLMWIHIWPLWVTAGSVLAVRGLLALRFRQPVWPVLLHPAAELILILLGLSSWRRCKSGRGVEWKGRRYMGRDEG